MSIFFSNKKMLNKINMQSPTDGTTWGLGVRISYVTLFLLWNVWAEILTYLFCKWVYALWCFVSYITLCFQERDHNSEDEDEDKYADDIDMPGQNFDSKRRITVRNLRIREDIAKVRRSTFRIVSLLFSMFLEWIKKGTRHSSSFHSKILTSCATTNLLFSGQNSSFRP